MDWNEKEKENLRIQTVFFVGVGGYSAVLLWVLWKDANIVSDINFTTLGDLATRNKFGCN